MCADEQITAGGNWSRMPPETLWDTMWDTPQNGYPEGSGSWIFIPQCPSHIGEAHSWGTSSLELSSCPVSSQQALKAGDCSLAWVPELWTCTWMVGRWPPEDPARPWLCQCHLPRVLATLASPNLSPHGNTYTCTHAEKKGKPAEYSSDNVNNGY